MLERLAQRYPRLFAFLAVLFVLLCNGIGGAIDSL
jgi:hypothetical protein